MMHQVETDLAQEEGGDLLDDLLSIGGFIDWCVGSWSHCVLTKCIIRSSFRSSCSDDDRCNPLRTGCVQMCWLCLHKRYEGAMIRRSLFERCTGHLNYDLHLEAKQVYISVHRTVILRIRLDNPSFYYKSIVLGVRSIMFSMKFILFWSKIHHV